jgi:hypothetical protein
MLFSARRSRRRGATISMLFSARHARSQKWPGPPKFPFTFFVIEVQVDADVHG